MCRLAAYLGPPLSLEQFMLATPHSLVVQSYQPAEMQTATLNADGFGVGWYNADGRPAAYRSTAPAWADPNLPQLGRSLERASWFANVRSATDPFSGGYANTQPFTVDHWLFMHNGFIADFPDGVRGRIRRWLGEEQERHIHGNTDSEYVFAAFRQVMAGAGGDWPAGFAELMGLLAEWAAGRRVLLNLIVGDGRRIAFLRHALNAEPPTLYTTAADPDFPDGRLVASEPLTDRAVWEPVTPGELWITDTRGGCERHTL